MSKCPKCERTVSYAKYDAIELKGTPMQGVWHGLAYSCPYCHSVLGIQIDPIAVKTDILNGVEKILKKVLRS